MGVTRAVTFFFSWRPPLPRHPSGGVAPHAGSGCAPLRPPPLAAQSSLSVCKAQAQGRCPAFDCVNRDSDRKTEKRKTSSTKRVSLACPTPAPAKTTATEKQEFKHNPSAIRRPLLANAKGTLRGACEQLRCGRSMEDGGCLELPAVRNLHRLAGRAVPGANLLNGLDHVHAVNDLAKHDVLACARIG